MILMTERYNLREAYHPEVSFCADFIVLNQEVYIEPALKVIVEPTRHGRAH